MKKLSAITLLIFCFILMGFSQENKPEQTIDTLNMIFSSESFTLEEDYFGDWGGHNHKFIFTVQGNKVRIQWENPELMENGEDMDMLFPIKALKDLEEIFVNCTEKIKTSKKGSTEHILYKFKKGKIIYIIDDKTTMECNDDFRAWKEKIISEWKEELMKEK